MHISSPGLVSRQAVDAARLSIFCFNFAPTDYSIAGTAPFAKQWRLIFLGGNFTGAGALKSDLASSTKIIGSGSDCDVTFLMARRSEYTNPKTRIQRTSHLRCCLRKPLVLLAAFTLVAIGAAFELIAPLQMIGVLLSFWSHSPAAPQGQAHLGGRNRRFDRC